MFAFVFGLVFVRVWFYVVVGICCVHARAYVDGVTPVLVLSPLHRALSLSSVSLFGSLPSSLPSLTALTLLDVSQNFVFAPLPSSMMSMTTLQSLKLSATNIQSTFPAVLSALLQLTYVLLEWQPRALVH